VWQAILPAGGLSSPPGGLKGRLQPGLAATHRGFAGTRTAQSDSLAHQGYVETAGALSLDPAAMSACATGIGVVNLPQKLSSPFFLGKVKHAPPRRQTSGGEPVAGAGGVAG